MSLGNIVCLCQAGHIAAAANHGAHVKQQSNTSPTFVVLHLGLMRPAVFSLPLLAPPQVYDLLCLLILAACTAILRAIKPGFIYFWLKVGDYALGI
jgi:hypothetical protein